MCIFCLYSTDVSVVFSFILFSCLVLSYLVSSYTVLANTILSGFEKVDEEEGGGGGGETLVQNAFLLGTGKPLFITSSSSSLGCQTLARSFADIGSVVFLLGKDRAGRDGRG